MRKPQVNHKAKAYTIYTEILKKGIKAEFCRKSPTHKRAGAREEERNKGLQNSQRNKKLKITLVNPSLSIITLNIYGIISPVKRQSSSMGKIKK